MRSLVSPIVIVKNQHEGGYLRIFRMAVRWFDILYRLCYMGVSYDYHCNGKDGLFYLTKEAKSKKAK